jgi:hypothetical protein
MKSIFVIAIFIILSAVAYSADVLGPTELTRIDTRDRITGAKTAIDSAKTARDGNYTSVSQLLGKCPDVSSKWNSVNSLISEADSHYNSAFNDFLLDYYEASYRNATLAIQKSNDAKTALKDLPNLIYLCMLDEKRTNASNAISEVRAVRAIAQEAIAGKLSCIDVKANWTQAELKWTLANTLYTSSDYASSKQASDEASASYQMAVIAADSCTPQATTPAVSTECVSDSDCATDRKCSLSGSCIAVECECGYVSNHICHAYDCCNDHGCQQGKMCQDHVCVNQPPKQQTPAAPQQTGQQ